MKVAFSISILIIFLFWACTQTDQKIDESSNTEQPTQTEKRTVEVSRFPSPAASVIQTIGRSTLQIDYSRPSVISIDGIDRTGKIWGKLVPYEFNFRPTMGGGKPRPWRAGANENTVIEFSHAAKVEGQSIAAGKYGLHIAVHENGGATLIFSNNSDSWGSFSYEESKDALRVEVITKEIPITERLVYNISNIDQTSGLVALDWEKKRFAFKVEFDTHSMVLNDYNGFLEDTTGLTWRDYNRAAAYCAANKVYLEEGIEWIEVSLGMEKNFTNLTTKSNIFRAMGRTAEALEVKSEALDLPSTTANNYYSYGTQMIRQGKIEEAMNIYQLQSEKFPNHWLTAHGLGRAYSAIGNFEMALQYEKEALEKAPEANKGFIEGAIKMLGSGIDFN